MYGGRIEAWFFVPAGVTVSATNTGGGPTSVAITAGAYTLATLATHLQAQLNAQRAPSSGAWTVTYSIGASGTGLVTIDCAGAWALSWTSTDLRDLLGFDANLASHTGASTGAAAACGLWLPKCPLSMPGHPLTAPVHTDLRTMQTPSGTVYGHKGTSKLKHTGLVYSHVPLTQYREASTTYANGSWEAFLRDTQHGEGHPWFRVASKVAIYWCVANTTEYPIGNDKRVRGWYLHGVEKTTATMSTEGLVSHYRIEIPTITASPADVDTPTPPSTWTVDATSGKGVPVDATEWATLIASEPGLSAWSAPTSLYLCQDAASPLDDAIGAFDLTFSGSGANYQQASAGWTRTEQRLTEGASLSRWSNTSGSLPDIGTQSTLLLAYVRMPSTVAAVRNLIQLGSGTAALRINMGTGFLQAISGGNSGLGATNMFSAGVVPLVLLVDRTNARVRGYSLTEKLAPSIAAAGSMTGQGCFVGAASGSSAGCGYLYAARWDFADAERTDADVKALMQALGFTVTWS